MEDDPLCSPDLFPFLRHVVVVITHYYLKELHLLVIEAVGGGDNPPVTDEGASTEVTIMVRMSE